MGEDLCHPWAFWQWRHPQIQQGLIQGQVRNLKSLKVLGLVTGIQTPPSISPCQGQGAESSCLCAHSSPALALVHPTHSWYLASREQCLPGEPGPRASATVQAQEVMGGPPGL